MLKGARPSSFLMTQSLVFNSCNWIFGLASGDLDLGPLLLFYGPLAGVSSYISRLLFLRSLRHGDISVHAPIFRLSFLVTAALAIALSGESLYPGKLVGMVLAVVAVVALLDPRRVARAGGMPGALPLGAATLGLGIYGWLQKLSVTAGVTPAGLLVAQGFMYLCIAIPSSTLAGTIRPNRSELIHAPVSGLLSSAAYLLLLYSLQTGEASVNIPIFQLSFVFTAVLAALFLGEQLSRGKVLGLLAAVMAVLVFNFRG